MPHNNNQPQRDANIGVVLLLVSTVTGFLTEVAQRHRQQIRDKFTNMHITQLMIQQQLTSTTANLLL